MFESGQSQNVLYPIMMIDKNLNAMVKHVDLACLRRKTSGMQKHILCERLLTVWSQFKRTDLTKWTQLYSMFAVRNILNISEVLSHSVNIHYFAQHYWIMIQPNAITVSECRNEHLQALFNVIGGCVWWFMRGCGWGMYQLDLQCWFTVLLCVCVWLYRCIKQRLWHV